MDDFHNNSSDDRLIRYDKLAPLEYLARAQCAINLIDYDEIRTLSANGYNLSSKKNVILDYLMEKISKLRLPRSINETLIQTTCHVFNEIGNWIKYHDEEIFNVGMDVHPIASRHLEAITWTSRSTIDYLASAKTLIMSRDFDVDTKFRIAYAYSLHDYMAEVSGKLLNSSIYLDRMFPKRDSDPTSLQRSALYYWLCYIYSNTLEIERIHRYRISTYTTVEMFLFNLFAPMPNYVIIEYVWNTMTTAEKIQGIQDLVNVDVSSDLLLYLLSKLSAQDQLTVIHSRVPHIYKILVNDMYKRPFHDKVIDYIFTTMNHRDFTEIIKQLLRSVSNPTDVTRHKCKQIFKNLWSSVSISIRYQALEYDRHPSVRLQHNRRYPSSRNQRQSMLLPSNWMDNEDIVELVLTDATIAQRKDYLKTDAAIDYAIQIIKKGKWTALESFIEKFLDDREDIFQYKASVIRGNDYDLVKYFYEANHLVAEIFYTWSFESKPRMKQFIVENRRRMWTRMIDFFTSKENINKVESFLEWCLLSPSERAQWLQEFQTDTWYKLIKVWWRRSLVEIEYFLDWSFKTSNDLYKSKFILPMNTSLFTKYVCVLIKENKYKLLNDLLNWCFLYDQRAIRKFKISFPENCDVAEFVNVIKFTVISRHDFLLFNRLLGEWFDNETDLRMFKIKIGEPKIASWIAAEFVSIYKLDMADKFFKICLEFDDNQLAEFKRGIILHESMNDVIVKFKSRTFIWNFEEWVNLPREKYLEFEKRFLSTE